MLVLLDTNILIDIEKGHQDTIEKLKALYLQFPNSELSVSWANYFEFYFGNETKEARDFLTQFAFMEMDKKSTEIFTELKKRKLDVNDFDLLIASVAIANGAMLVTKDNDFEKVKGLNLKMINEKLR
jgi:predicted nucleic acid-binding protein